jgi:hypothetical protein
MTRYTAFRCPEDLLERAKTRARSDRRSLSNYIITLIEKDVGSEESGAASPPRKRGSRTTPLRVHRGVPEKQD